MKRETIYRQCGLVRDLGNDRSSNLVSYIPAKFAKQDRIVKLKQDNGEWQDGWKVVLVGATTSSNELPDSHQAVKQHRNATGDSLRR